MSQFLLDDFSGAGALDSAIWQTPVQPFLSSPAAGISQVGGNAVTTTATAGTSFGGEAQGTAVPPSADYNIILQGVNFVTTGTSHDGGILMGLRYHDAGGFPSFFYASLNMTSGWFVEKVDDTDSPYDPPGSTGTLPSAPFDAELRVVGSLVTFFLNGVSVFSFTDTETPPLTAVGRPYLAIYTVAGTGSTSSVQVSHAEANSITSGPFWTDFVGTTES